MDLLQSVDYMKTDMPPIQTYKPTTQTWNKTLMFKKLC